jgi:hypothetical protein
MRGKLNTRTAVLAAAAASALIASATALRAQGYNPRYGNGPQVSTPEEMQETNQLNQQAIEGTTQSPAVLNGEAPSDYNAAASEAQQNTPLPYEPSQTQYSGPPSDYANAPIGDAPPDAQPPPDQLQYAEPPSQYDNGYDNGPASDQPSNPQAPPGAYETQYGGPQSQYGAQEQQYQNQLQQYQNQQQRYGYEQGRYARNLRNYDLAQYAWSYPAAYAYRYGDAYGLQPLYLLAEPSEMLSQAPVEGPGGQWVGRVRNVEIAVDGRPQRVEIALNRRVSVWVSPGNLRYDPGSRILFTDLSRNDLWDMPGATITSTPL